MQLVWSCVVLIASAGCQGKHSGAEASDAASTPERSPAADPRSSPHCPEEMVAVDSFCIDPYEAELVRIDAPEQLHPYSERPRAGIRYRARSRQGAKPQGYMSKVEAEQACQNASKRLCRAAEWYRACAGSYRRKFPYGNEEIKQWCNTGKDFLPAKVFGASTPLTSVSHFNNPRLNQEPGFLAAAGEYSRCVTEEGTHDMVGNLHEWVSDPVSPDLRKQIPIAYGDHLMGAYGNGVFMGGYFSSNGEHGTGCQYATTHHAPLYHDYSIGFRCCARPE